MNQLAILTPGALATGADTRPLDKIADSIRDCFATMRSSAATMAAWAILTGLELNAADAALGERRGRPRADAAEKPQTFDDWLEAQAFDFSRTSAYHFKRIAESSQKKMLKLGGESVMALLGKAPGAMDEAERGALEKLVAGFADERTLSELTSDLGLARKKKRGAQKDDAEESDECQPGWAEDEWAEYQALGAEPRAAVDRFRWLYLDLGNATADDLLAHLPARWLAEFRDAAKTAAEKLSAMAPTAKGKKGGAK